MKEENIWRTLKMAVSGVDRLMRFLNNPLTYVDDSGEMDSLLHLKLYASIQMLFADLLAVNYSTEPHSQISFSFSFLDKLANLRKHFGELSGSESNLVAELASTDFGKKLTNLVKAKMSEIHPDLAASWLPVVKNCYSEIHSHLSRELGHLGTSEGEILRRLRSLRNLSHGTFLRDEQFNEVFFEASGVVPPTLAALPLFLTMGLVLSPKDFLTM